LRRNPGLIDGIPLGFALPEITFGYRSMASTGKSASVEKPAARFVHGLRLPLLNSVTGPVAGKSTDPMGV
jgi:hypothetical protein